MDSFTLISNFFVIAVLFIITCPDEGKGYVRVDWSDLNRKALESSINRFNQLREAANRGKRMEDDNDDGRTTPYNQKFPGTFQDNSPIILPQNGEDKNEVSSEESYEDVKDDVTKKMDSYDELRVIPLNKSPVKHEKTANFKRSANNPSGLIILPSRL